VSERTKAQLLAENKRLRAEVERLDRIVNPPPPEPPEEPAPKPRLYVLALGEVEKRIVPNAFQIPEAIKSIAPDAEWVPVYRLSDLPRDGYAVRVVDYVTAGFGRGAREIKWYRTQGAPARVRAATQKQVERFRGVSEPLNRSDGRGTRRCDGIRQRAPRVRSVRADRRTACAVRACPSTLQGRRA
jgi:hypothetical protein